MKCAKIYKADFFTRARNHFIVGELLTPFSSRGAKLAAYAARRVVQAVQGDVISWRRYATLRFQPANAGQRLPSFGSNEDGTIEEFFSPCFFDQLIVAGPDDR